MAAWDAVEACSQFGSSTSSDCDCNDKEGTTAMPPPIPQGSRTRRSDSSRLRLPPLRDWPEHASRLYASAIEKFNSLSTLGKCSVALVALLQFAAIITVVRLGTHGILEYLYDAALWFSTWPTLGPLLLIGLISILSFPPLVGYGTSITLCGLAYGTELPDAPGHGLFLAWLLASTGCLCGSSLVFIFFRRYLNRPLHTLPEWINTLRSKREWLAMEKAVQTRGYQMILLIRFCPFPFVYSNLFFASLQPGIVSYDKFLLATIATTPKLFLHVFIGAKTFQAIQAARGGQGDDKTTTSPSHSWVSMAYIIFASLVGFVTSWYIYAETKKVLDEFLDEDRVEESLEEGLLERDREPNAEQRQPQGVQESWGWSDDEEPDEERNERTSSSAPRS